MRTTKVAALYRENVEWGLSYQVPSFSDESSTSPLALLFEKRGLEEEPGQKRKAETPCRNSSLKRKPPQLRVCPPPQHLEVPAQKRNEAAEK